MEEVSAGMWLTQTVDDVTPRPSVRLPALQCFNSAFAHVPLVH